MDQRRLGSSDLQVGAIGLGCMGMSWGYSASERDDDRSVGVIHRALELGVTLVDTADVYGPFVNEELVGRALAGRRDEVVLATKGGMVAGRDGEMPHRNGRPEHLRSAAEESLRRLGTDRIDLYYLHRIDPDVPVEESWGAMAELVDEGKVRALGLSEASVEELDRAHAIHPVAALQSELSLWTRDALGDVLAWCEEHDAALVPFAPLGRGWLTGRLAADTSFESTDFRSRNPRFSAEARSANEAIVDAVREVADRRDAAPGQVALAWVLAQGGQVVPIPGTKRVPYLEENVAAADVHLEPEDLAALDGLPQASGSRY